MNKLFTKSYLAIALLLVSCSTQMGISNGAYSDISLVRESKDYSIKRLKEVNTEGKTLMGIPVGKSSNKKQGIIVRFNGVNLNNSNGFLPILSMIGLTITTGYGINVLVGHKQEKVSGYDYTIESDKYKLGLIISSILAIPISGAINNQIWSGSAYSRAAFNANSILLQENPNVDVFLNPKYEIVKQAGIWTQKVKFKAKVMGATIKED